MPDPLPMTVVAGSNRPSRRDQIDDLIARAQARGEPIRLRLPLSFYDYSDSRSYSFLRDAAWNLSLPSTDATPETIEALIRSLGACLVAIATHGSARVEEVLRLLQEGTTVAQRVGEAGAESEA